MSSHQLGVLLTLVGGVLWGFSGVCGQYLFLQGISADFLVPYRLLLAGAFIVLYYAFKAPKAVFAPLTDIKLLAELLTYALLGLMMTQYAYFYSIELSNAAVATVIQYTAPVLILAIICLKEKRAPRPLEILALLCAMLGVFFLATHAQISALVISPKALFWCLVSAVCVCVYNLAPARLNAKYSVALTLGTIFAFSFYMTGVKLIGASKASMIACIEPLSAAFFGYFWLGTKFLFWDFLGFALIISCIFLLSKKRDDIPSAN
ncbi:DMT family transporter [Campylobacter concisus]|jgi:transporter|uniref:DMT family transporter n=1 Tax=Campylobacter concisus TaxID=199 RepID=UPI000CD9B246|nr:EamA family transporter [Campylobacter concisus]